MITRSALSLSNENFLYAHSEIYGKVCTVRWIYKIVSILFDEEPYHRLLISVSIKIRNEEKTRRLLNILLIERNRQAIDGFNFFLLFMSCAVIFLSSSSSIFNGLIFSK